jgi:hypothetical protein
MVPTSGRNPQDAYDIYDQYHASGNPKTAEKFKAAVVAGVQVDEAVDARREAEETANVIALRAAFALFPNDTDEADGIDRNAMEEHYVSKFVGQQKQVEVEEARVRDLVVQHQRAATAYEKAAERTDRSHAAGKIARAAAPHAVGVIAAAGAGLGVTAIPLPGTVLAAPAAASAAKAAATAATERAVERRRPTPPPKQDVYEFAAYRQPSPEPETEEG